MDDPFDIKGSDGKFYIGLVIFVLVVVVGVFAMVVHQRGGLGPPPPPNAEDLRRDNLAAPGLTDAEVLAFSTDIIAAAITFDARNFHNQLAALQPYFTPDGWTLFNRALVRLDVVNMMQTGRFTVTPELAGEPVIRSKGVEAAIYQWRVVVPLSLSLEAKDRTLERDMVAHIRLIREPLARHPEGLAIDTLNFLPGENAGQL